MFLKNLFASISIMVVCAGCTPLLKAFTVESPRPNQAQIGAAQSISEKNVPVIAGMQTDKQSRIASVARAGLHAISKATTPAQVEGITNVIANATEGIQQANGTAKILGAAQERTTADILKMSIAEYGLYAATQATVATHNIYRAKEGIKAGWQWTAKAIAAAIAASTGGVGLAGLATMSLRKALQRKQLLIATGGAIEDFRTAHPETSEELKNVLAEAHSSIPVDAKKEFGLS